MIVKPKLSVLHQLETLPPIPGEMYLCPRMFRTPAIVLALHVREGHHRQPKIVGKMATDKIAMIPRNRLTA